VQPVSVVDRCSLFFNCVILLNMPTHQERAEQRQKRADTAADSSADHGRELVEMQERAHIAADRVKQAQARQRKGNRARRTRSK
jgi:hypothetical protein